MRNHEKIKKKKAIINISRSQSEISRILFCVAGYHTFNIQQSARTKQRREKTNDCFLAFFYAIYLVFKYNLTKLLLQQYQRRKKKIWERDKIVQYWGIRKFVSCSLIRNHKYNGRVWIIMSIYISHFYLSRCHSPKGHKKGLKFILASGVRIFKILP